MGGERPRHSAAKRGHEASPIYVDCHVTLRGGRSHATEKTISWFNRAVCDQAGAVPKNLPVHPRRSRLYR